MLDGDARARPTAILADADVATAADLVADLPDAQVDKLIAGHPHGGEIRRAIDDAKPTSMTTRSKSFATACPGWSRRGLARLGAMGAGLIVGAFEKALDDAVILASLIRRLGPACSSPPSMISPASRFFSGRQDFLSAASIFYLPDLG